MICSKQAGSFRRPAAILKTIERETAKDKVGVSTNWPPYCLKSSNHVICRLPEISLSRLLSWKPLTEKSLGTRLGLPQTGRHLKKILTKKLLEWSPDSQPFWKNSDRKTPRTKLADCGQNIRWTKIKICA